MRDCQRWAMRELSLMTEAAGRLSPQPQAPALLKVQKQSSLLVFLGSIVSVTLLSSSWQPRGNSHHTHASNASSHGHLLYSVRGFLCDGAAGLAQSAAL